ncbi:hypothetical protein ABS858_00975 [Vibrio neptunius]|uniref:hypothetical protein n=1 Tax=Vibrio neptunius TaxID=170651 RepID=UPI0033149A88
MNKKLLLGLGVAAALVAGVSYYVTKPYFEEKARIELLADQLESRNKSRYPNGVRWRYSYDFDIPDNPTVADWNTEQLKLPQVLFTVTNPEDETKVSYWALSIDGTNPQLLIPDGVLPPPPFRSTTDYSKYMSRSPNGRYLVIPQKGGSILYDLANGEKTRLGEVATSPHVFMWDVDSTQVVVKKRDELLLVKLDTKAVLKFEEINGPLARRAVVFGSTYMSQSEQMIYISFDRDMAGGSFYCGESEEYIATFGDHGVPNCGNTLVFDAKTLQLVDRGDFTPNAYYCNVRDSKFSDGFYCAGAGEGKVFRLGRPSQQVGQHPANATLLALNGGDIWLTALHQRNISRVLAQPIESSPTKEMFYTYGGLHDGERAKVSAFGFGFSRYVIEHKDSESWSESLYPLPSYSDIEKAKLVLQERNHGDR